MSVYKNLPPNIRHDFETNTAVYGCFDVKGKYYYYYKREPYMISSLPISNKFDEEYKHDAVGFVCCVRIEYKSPSKFTYKNGSYMLNLCRRSFQCTY